MKRFDIYGDIVDTEAEKTTLEDVCPKDITEFLKTVDDGEDIELHVNSCGGSVTAGISIANQIIAASKEHKTTAYIDGLAASIASVICMAVEELHMPENAFMMIHRAWGIVEGNCEELRQQADIMEKMNQTLVSFYHRKFDLTDEQLNEYLAAETWFSGAEAEAFKLNAIVEKSEVKLAASAKKKIQSFHNKTNIERVLNMEEEKEEIEEVKKTEPEEVVQETSEEVEEQQVEEQQTESPEEKTEQEPSLEEQVKKLTEENASLKKQLDDCMKKLDECKPDEDVEKRVSGMQSKMQNKINDLTKDFKDKLELKDKELSELKNQVSDLVGKLEKASSEFSEMESALEEKKNALATLNASVNTPAASVNWKNLKGKAFRDWVEAGYYKNI